MSKLSELIRKMHKSGRCCSAVILAAGSSTRAGRDKLFTPLHGVPVLAHTLMAFESSTDVNEIIVVTREEKIVAVADLCRKYSIRKVTKVLCGGETRAHSALAGVSEVSRNCKLIAVHDGARPFTTPKLIGQIVHAAALHKAAAPAIPVKDTLKTIESDFAVSTVSRDETRAVQTPQVFQTDLLKAALTNAVCSGLPITDDCSAVEELGFRVRLVEGDEENIKITTPLDFLLAEAIMESRHKA